MYKFYIHTFVVLYQGYQLLKKSFPVSPASSSVSSVSSFHRFDILHYIEMAENVEGKTVHLISPVESKINSEFPGHIYDGQSTKRDSRGEPMTKFFTNCDIEHARSLKCIEDNYDKKSVCQPFFDDYKKCRAEERQRRLEENGKKEGCIIS